MGFASSRDLANGREMGYYMHQAQWPFLGQLRGSVTLASLAS